MQQQPVTFEGRSFCFTGKLADLKRAEAERETRARNGLTQDVVNAELHYLVVGSIPATGWKFGNYGNKIAKAMEIVENGAEHPILVGESSFMDALAIHPPTNSGAIDGKVQIASYTFFVQDGKSFDRRAVDAWLQELKQLHRCHVRARVTPARAYNDLYAWDGRVRAPDGSTVFEVRACRQVPIEADSGALVQLVRSRFETIAGVQGEARWYERSEGSADYVKLLQKIPDDLKLPEL